MNEPIYFLSKTDQYSEFSNFHHAPIKIDDKIWKTTEAYFQAQKFLHDPAYQETIRNAQTPTMAKKLGSTRKVKIRDDWEQIKDDVMSRALYAKFMQHQTLKQLLLSTGNRPLVENNKRDNYWGIGNGNGLNKLGKALCDLRERLNK